MLTIAEAKKKLRESIDINFPNTEHCSNKKIELSMLEIINNEQSYVENIKIYSIIIRKLIEKEKLINEKLIKELKNVSNFISGLEIITKNNIFIDFELKQDFFLDIIKHFSLIFCPEYKRKSEHFTVPAGKQEQTTASYLENFDGSKNAGRVNNWEHSNLFKIMVRLANSTGEIIKKYQRESIDFDQSVIDLNKIGYDLSQRKKIRLDPEELNKKIIKSIGKSISYALHGFNDTAKEQAMVHLNSFLNGNESFSSFIDNFMSAVLLRGSRYRLLFQAFESEIRQYLNKTPEQYHPPQKEQILNILGESIKNLKHELGVNFAENYNDNILKELKTKALMLHTIFIDCLRSCQGENYSKILTLCVETLLLYRLSVNKDEYVHYKNYFLSNIERKFASYNKIIPDFDQVFQLLKYTVSGRAGFTEKTIEKYREYREKILSSNDYMNYNFKELKQSIINQLNDLSFQFVMQKKRKDVYSYELLVASDFTRRLKSVSDTASLPFIDFVIKIYQCFDESLFISGFRPKYYASILFDAYKKNILDFIGIILDEIHHFQVKLPIKETHFMASDMLLENTSRYPFETAYSSNNDLIVLMLYNLMRVCDYYNHYNFCLENQNILWKHEAKQLSYVVMQLFCKIEENSSLDYYDELKEIVNQIISSLKRSKLTGLRAENSRLYRTMVYIKNNILDEFNLEKIVLAFDLMNKEIWLETSKARFFGQKTFHMFIIPEQISECAVYIQKDIQQALLRPIIRASAKEKFDHAYQIEEASVAMPEKKHQFSPYLFLSRALGKSNQEIIQELARLKTEYKEMEPKYIKMGEKVEQHYQNIYRQKMR